MLAIDQGTTGTRAILYDAAGREAGSAYREFRQHYPRPGWVEHDAEEIWRATAAVVRGALERSRADASRVAAIGITNQRETTVLWDADTGRPAGRAIVWQDRRTADFCAALKRRGAEPGVRRKTGLVLDPYFSGTKIRWLLRERPALAARARSGRLRFGTMDSWLLWNLTGGRSHATDLTNASRTLLLDLRSGRWDPELLRLFGVPEALLPRALEPGSRFGETAALGFLPAGIPILAMLGDQQAALYGQGCYAAGQAKNTYGTGCFVVMNAGPRPQAPPPGLLATLACDARGRKVYALEGSIFIAGAAVQWLRDGLGLVRRAPEIEALARSVPDSGGVAVVPAFAGLGSPYWRPDARGMISGITRGTTKAHLARATLESIAHQSADVLELMQKAAGRRVRELKADGGATGNALLMQLQADLAGMPIRVSDVRESTAWGAAKLAGLGAGLWDSPVPLDRRRRYRVFSPRMPRSEAARMRAAWRREIARVLA